jgi:hypothetical protein
MGGGLDVRQQAQQQSAEKQAGKTGLVDKLNNHGPIKPNTYQCCQLFAF